jgi:hypothetical protein
MNNYTQIPTDEVINTTVEALAKSNIEAFVVENGEEAKKKFHELVPEGSQVFTNTSTTFDQLGLTSEINDSGKFVSLKNEVVKLAKEKPDDAILRKQVGSAMPYATGSIHAITQDGHVVIASGSGSQIPGYAYGANHIVWIASANKIVENIDEGIKRIYEYILPFEDARMKKMYGPESGSNPRRILIFNSEGDINKDRTKLILVKEPLGF